MAQRSFEFLAESVIGNQDNSIGKGAQFYSGGIQFDSRPRHRHSYWNILCSFPHSPQGNVTSYDRILSSPFSFTLSSLSTPNNLISLYNAAKRPTNQQKQTVKCQCNGRMLCTEKRFDLAGVLSCVRPIYSYYLSSSQSLCNHLFLSFLEQDLHYFPSSEAFISWQGA
jgi:hypothetical protein